MDIVCLQKTRFHANPAPVPEPCQWWANPSFTALRPILCGFGASCYKTGVLDSKPWDIVDHLQGSFGPFSPKSKKVSKGVPGASWAPGPRGPGDPFRDFFRTLGRKTQITPVNGKRYRNPNPLISRKPCPSL